MQTKIKLYCNPSATAFNWEKISDLKKLPKLLMKWGRVEVEFRKYVPKKSLKQLGYFHGGILPYLEKKHWITTGWTSNNWRDNLKEQFGVRIYSKCGKYHTVKSIAKYSEKEMSDFIEKVLDFSLHTLCDQIPAPLHIEDYL